MPRPVCRAAVCRISNRFSPIVFSRRRLIRPFASGRPRSPPGWPGRAFSASWGRFAGGFILATDRCRLEPPSHLSLIAGSTSQSKRFNRHRTRHPQEYAGDVPSARCATARGICRRTDGEQSAICECALPVTKVMVRMAPRSPVTQRVGGAANLPRSRGPGILNALRRASERRVRGLDGGRRSPARRHTRSSGSRCGI